MDTRLMQQNNDHMSKGRANKKAYQTLKILTKSTKRKTMITIDNDKNQ